MSKSNNNLSNSFENAFKKNKNIVLAAPVVLLVLILGIYYTSETPANNSKSPESIADTSIPSSETKPLSDSKVDVTTDYEMMTEENQKKQSEADAVNLSDPNVSTSSTYEKPDDEVINKVNKMLGEMDKSSKKSTNTPRPSLVVNKSKSYSETDNSETKNQLGEEKETKNQNGFGFFSNEKGISNSSRKEDNNNQEKLFTDDKIYACVHTDQVLKTNTRIKLRLTRTAVIDNITYPINTIVYGIARIASNRMFVEISAINQNKCSELEIYDAEDSNRGIYVLTPNFNETVKKEIGTEVLENDSDLNKIPFSKTIKSLLEKKLQEEKIELLNNYKIIIKKKKKNEN